MSQIVHASAAAFDGQGVLIIGDSGSGKSTLLLQLLGLGALLVGDDQVELNLDGDVLTARAAPNIKQLIEVRGIGILAAPSCDIARVRLVVDLNRAEPERLPQRHLHHDFGTPLDLVLGKGNVALAAAIRLLLQGARVA